MDGSPKIDCGYPHDGRADKNIVVYTHLSITLMRNRD